MDTGIYAIRNITNGKCYIGSAQSFNSRFGVHKSCLNKNRHHSAKLQHAWNKYGAESFVFEKIIICSKENLLMYEQIFIDGYNSVKSGYNILPIAGSNAGRVVSEETKQKISQAQIGKIVSEETKKKLAIAKTGIKHNKETKKKMSKDRRIAGIKKRIKSISLDKCTLKYWFFNLGGNDKLC